jgi:hypothetical protein
VHEAREAFLRYVEGGGWVAKEEQVQAYGEFPSGLPHLSVDFDSELLDFDSPFGPIPSKGNPICYSDWDSVNRLLELAVRHPMLRRTSFAESIGGDRVEHHFRIEIGHIPFDIFERLMNVYGADFTDAQLQDVYCEVEAGRLLEKLPVSIAIPIVCTRIEPERVMIGPNATVFKLSKAQHLARASTDFRLPGPSVSATVADAATHALVLKGASIDNRLHGEHDNYMSLSWYPTEEIDRFFDALRVATGLDTGYAQIHLIPEGWAWHLHRDLPPLIQGAAARRYPGGFDHYGWLGEKRAVSAAELEQVSVLFATLAGSERLALAAKRLSSAMLHDSDEDAVLDLMIGLEALLGDRRPSEMTHKLALRCAAVLGLVGADPVVVFDSVKKLYRYRSAVAHGDTKNTEKWRSIEIDGRVVGATALATRFLRETISVLSQRTELIDGDQVDLKLVLPALAATQPEQAQAGRPK